MLSVRLRRACAVMIMTAARALLGQTTGTALAGDWAGVIRGPSSVWHVHIAVTRDSAGLRASVDFPDANAYERPFVTTLSGSIVRFERPQPGGTPVVLTGHVDGDTLRGTWTGFGHEAPFTAWRTPTAPLGYREEAVTFRNGDVTLAGTLFLPAIGARHRALVCVHGSGPVDRSAYRGKAVYLARRGTATLVYDKRGVGASTGDWTTASANDLALDALAGVALLRAHPAIDSSRVGIEGFSQGGWIAPLAATLSRHIAFVIVGSAAGLNPAEQSIYDVAHQMAHAGIDSATIARATALRRRLYDSTADSLSRVSLAAELDRVHAEPWFKASALPYPFPVTAPSPGEVEFLRLEPEPIWRHVTVPVLAYWGGRDQRVPVGESIALVRRGLARAGNSHLTVQVYPDADHVMAHVADPVPPGTWDFPRGVAYLQLIADWLNAR